MPSLLTTDSEVDILTLTFQTSHPQNPRDSSFSSLVKDPVPCLIYTSSSSPLPLRASSKHQSLFSSPITQSLTLSYHQSLTLPYLPSPKFERLKYNIRASSTDDHSHQYSTYRTVLPSTLAPQAYRSDGDITPEGTRAERQGTKVGTAIFGQREGGRNLAD